MYNTEIIIAITAFFASLLTFFSGFGLGTILSAVMLLFFPPELAIALTGVVHFLNNCFKIGVMKNHINWKIGFPFAIAALIGSFFGAVLLFRLSSSAQALFTYQLFENSHQVTFLKLLIAVLMLLFVFLEIVPSFQKIQFGKKSIVPGGLISGFFGGLTGMQGALRSMFLLKIGLSKEVYIATGIMIAFAVDISRLTVYYKQSKEIDLSAHTPLLLAAILSAFLGAYIGSKILKKVTVNFVQNTVAALLSVLAVCLGTGLI